LLIALTMPSSECDCRVAITSVRQARRIMTAKALAPFNPQEVLPGRDQECDAELLKTISNIATTIFHPVGTCGMGPDADAVVMIAEKAVEIIAQDISSRTFAQAS